MNSAAKYLVIPGTRYRCCVQLVSVQGLDDLAQFFYDHVLSKEDRISHLIQAFGLPRRVIEDVLAELLETNRASLDIWNGRIIKSEARRERRMYSLGPTLEIWQDNTNGAALPFSLVQHFQRPAGLGKNEVWFKKSPAVIPLINMPGGRALGTILAGDPKLNFSFSADNRVPDGLVDIEVVSSFELRFKIDRVQINDKTVEFVEGMGLPSWLTRAWSFELATAGVDPQAARTETLNEALILAQEASVRHIHASADLRIGEVDLRDWLMRWRKEFDEVAKICSESIQQGNTFALEHLKQKLAAKKNEIADLIIDSGRVELVDVSAGHLQQLWEEADRYLLFAYPEFGANQIETIFDFTEGQKKKATHLILINCSGRPPAPELEAKVQELSNRKASGEIVLVSTETVILGQFCIVDGKEAWLGNLPDLWTRGIFVKVVGRAVLRYLSAFLSNKLQVREGGGWWVSRHFSGSAVACFEMLEGLNTALSQFDQLNHDLEDVIDDAWRAISEHSNSDAKAETLVPADLTDRLVALEHKALEICNHIAAEFLRDRILIEPVPAGDLFLMCQQALDYVASGTGHRLTIILNDIPASIAAGSTLHQLQKLVATESKIQIILSTSSGSIDTSALQILRSLEKEFALSELQVSVSSAHLPCALIIDEEKVILGWGSWFDATHGPNQFGFTMKSAGLSCALKNFIDRYSSI